MTLPIRTPFEWVQECNYIAKVAEKRGLVFAGLNDQRALGNGHALSPQDLKNLLGKGVVVHRGGKEGIHAQGSGDTFRFFARKRSGHHENRYLVEGGIFG